MQDRFRFRFWDKETQTMQKFPKIELKYRITLDKIFSDDRVIFMQCTGLKDKNGKLIYEGDIVRVVTQPNIVENIGIVKWDNTTAQFLRTANLINRNSLVSFWWNNTNSEVIGNIYESHELLGD